VSLSSTCFAPRFASVFRASSLSIGSVRVTDGDGFSRVIEARLATSGILISPYAPREILQCQSTPGNAGPGRAK
jgi:hypothetical protein